MSVANLVKERLQAGQTVVGTSAGLDSDARFLSNAGFDFLLYDTQHSTLELKQLGPVLNRLRGRDTVPIVRVAENRQDQICFALDAGARGIVAPMINSPEEAADLVSWARYPFEGVRSSAGVRGDWGQFENYREYMDAVNQQLLIVPMIETVESLDAIDEIASVPGVDMLLIGPSDLSINLDVPLDYTCDTYIEALETIAAACEQANIAAGLYFAPPGLAPEQLKQLGYRFFTVPWQGWAAAGVQAELDTIRD